MSAPHTPLYIIHLLLCWLRFFENAAAAVLSTPHSCFFLPYSPCYSFIPSLGSHTHGWVTVTCIHRPPSASHEVGSDGLNLSTAAGRPLEAPKQAVGHLDTDLQYFPDLSWPPSVLLRPFNRTPRNTACTKATADASPSASCTAHRAGVLRTPLKSSTA